MVLLQTLAHSKRVRPKRQPPCQRLSWTRPRLTQAQAQQPSPRRSRSSPILLAKPWLRLRQPLLQMAAQMRHTTALVMMQQQPL